MREPTKQLRSSGQRGSKYSADRASNIVMNRDRKTDRADGTMNELREIVRLAIGQGEGPYTTESDARAALDLIRRLALVLIAERAAGRGAKAGPA